MRTRPPAEYTHPDVFTMGVEDGWAEREADPTRIDWRERQDRALIPFQVVDGRPVNPCERTRVARGRNEMGFWGETQMCDALTHLTCAGHRQLLMVERRDGLGWAAPGGRIEDGETALEGALRELAEETKLEGATPQMCRVLAPRYVPDPRASREAWAVTVPVVIAYGEIPVGAGLPPVLGRDDALRAAWVMADSYKVLTRDLRARYGGRVFAAHTGMLKDLLAAAA